MLLLEAEGAQNVTLEDVPRVFQERDYRMLLVECCANQHVRAFWDKTVNAITHDEIEPPNVAPYITSKFEPLLGSRAIRTIIGRHTTTLDFGALMDGEQAVLISLAKGMLGTNEARVLGLLLLQQIQIACMGRARQPRATRRPVTLYVDEAHSFIGGALMELLAEARKFRLSLVLATQTMAQLYGRTSRALPQIVLGNVANLLVLRVGVQDAELFEPWFRPAVNAEDLIGLPDFTCCARILEGGRVELWRHLLFEPDQITKNWPATRTGRNKPGRPGPLYAVHSGTCVNFSTAVRSFRGWTEVPDPGNGARSIGFAKIMAQSLQR